MPRLFVALDLPEPARDKLADVSADLPGADWVYSEQYHLTLRFIGEVDVHAFEAVREGLGGILARSFHLSLRGMGVFPLRGDPEVLWAGVSKSGELLSLQHKVESRLKARGIGPDTRRYFPHVTLARVKHSDPYWVGQYVADHSLFSIPEIPIRSFSLFSSKLTPEGAEHHVEETYPLEGILDDGE